jgi:hypothetical protein
MENELNKKQTAVQWLLNQISINGFKQDIEQALQMDKEQKKDAWEDGVRSDNGFFGTFEQYYAETYGKTFLDLVSDEESKVHEVVRKLKEKKN